MVPNWRGERVELISRKHRNVLQQFVHPFPPPPPRHIHGRSLAVAPLARLLSTLSFQVLHDAFFKHQTKPPLTSPGDLYYEGKEFEAKNQEHKPGHISSELREVSSGRATPLCCRASRSRVVVVVPLWRHDGSALLGVCVTRPCWHGSSSTPSRCFRCCVAVTFFLFLA